MGCPLRSIVAALAINASQSRLNIMYNAVPKLARSFPSAVSATPQPSLTLPRTFDAGTRTSVKNISLNSASPVIIFNGRTATPGLVMSTNKQVRPLCLGAAGSVRTTSKHQLATWPKLVQIF